MSSLTTHVRDKATRQFIKMGALPPLLIAAIVFFSIANPIILSINNITSLSEQSVYLLLITLGQMTVLIAGGFDLSVGATVALSSIISALVTSTFLAANPDSASMAISLGFCAAILVGLAVGVINGLGVALLKVNPFIITLATSSVIAGITLVVSGGQQVSGLPDAYIYTIGSGEIQGIPVPVLMTVPVVIVLWIVLRFMRFGRHLFAIGSNLAAAHITGIRVRTTLIITYVICAVLSSYAGWLLTARVSSGQPLLGGQFALQSIAAALIGGATLAGGRGGVGGAVLGVAFIMLLTNGMNLMRLDSNAQSIAIGVALVFAVAADHLRSRARRQMSRKQNELVPGP